MSKIGAVAWKELRQIGRDPLFLAMLVGLPAFMLVVFGYAVNFDVSGLRTVVEDRDRSPASRQLVAAMAASGRFELVGSVASGKDLHRLFQRGQACLALVIPERFQRQLEAGRPAPIQLVVDGTDANSASTAVGYADGVLQTFNAARWEWQRHRGGAGTVLGPLIELQPRVWYNPELESSHFLVPGLIGFILMVTAVLSTALSVVREKEQGTMEQLSVAPLSTLQIMVGKALPFLVISLVAVVLILVSARYLFDLVIAGSLAELFAVTTLYLLGGIGLGLLISSVARSQGVAFQLGVFASMLPSLLLSGFVFPLANMPLFLQVLSRAVPARYFLTVLRGVVLRGASLANYPAELIALAAFAVLTLGVAAWRFARLEG